MSKIICKYLELKKQNPKKLYLFKSGKFYIFVGEDCDFINEYVVLKKVRFSKDYFKCGFPDVVLDDYMKVFKNHKLDVQIITDFNIKSIGIEEFINKININEISPLEALNLIKEMKEIINAR